MPGINLNLLVGTAPLGQILADLMYTEWMDSVRPQDHHIGVILNFFIFKVPKNQLEFYRTFDTVIYRSVTRVEGRIKSTSSQSCTWRECTISNNLKKKLPWCILMCLTLESKLSLCYWIKVNCLTLRDWEN